jgi:hypothetical protein
MSNININSIKYHVSYIIYEILNFLKSELLNLIF